MKKYLFFWQKDKKAKQKKTILSFKLTVLLVAVVLFCLGRVYQVQALDLQTGPAAESITGIKTVDKTLNNIAAQILKYFPAEKKKEFSLHNVLLNVTTKALNTVAFETATWLGSGGEGQKPLFVTEGWTAYLANVGDEAVGNFIEGVAKESAASWGVKFQLCKPDLKVVVSIGLGLREQVRPSPPACTFSKMKDNWEKYVSDINNTTFLNDVQDMFNPTSNDLGVAFTLHTKMIEEQKKALDAQTKDRQETQGWLDVKDVLEGPGSRSSSPRFAAALADEMIGFPFYMMGEDFGDAYLNAQSVFLNQFLITFLKTQLSKLGKNQPSYTSPYTGDYGGLANKNASPTRNGSAGVKKLLYKLLEPNFSQKADYNIISELETCPDPTKAGPTNCVINNKFSQAIQNNLTVAEAIKKGYLNPDFTFGFKGADNQGNWQEPDEGYKGSYPYRSILILRKYRIVPIGWEVAAVRNMTDVTATSTKLTLGYLVACFNDSSYPIWCRNLVDPYWVLKAPQNYCKKQGPGEKIESAEVINDELQVSRDTNYCGDEQSCIKENKDGSCVYYGYCMEERRLWKFSSDPCEPIYNTCMTLKDSAGSSVSYLQNTLDYGICSVDNAGCKAYCEDYNYDTSRYACSAATAAADHKIYLDREAQGCDEGNQGCHEFVRTKEGLGANLFVNGGFENDALATASAGAGATTPLGEWLIHNDVQGTIEDDTVPNAQIHSGLKSLHINTQRGGLAVYFNRNLPNGFIMNDNEAYTFSAWVYVKSGSVLALIGSLGNWKLATSTQLNNWEKMTITVIKQPGIDIDQIAITGEVVPAEFYIDDMQLEKGPTATAYSSYRQRGLVYEKLLPNYLYNTCYTNAPGDYSFKEPHPAICDNYVRLCNANEAGCEMYTGIADGLSVPAKVTIDNRCPAECVNYDQYLQDESYFESARTALLIPKLAKKCSSAAVGCDEFTNLDKLAAGGESKAYYTYVRQCIKPGADCAEFYTWEGSDETGYQIKVNSLEDKDRDGVPDVTDAITDAAECSATIYNASPDAADYNADCTQFYNRAGDISYHLYSLTISCSDDCHPFRRTENNTDPTITSAANCGTGAACNTAVDVSSCWDNATNVCNVCRNGGTWSAEHQACIYMAIPSEGQACSAALAGCREFSGNTGNNMRIVVNSSFEGSTEGWTGDIVNSPNNESLRLGGHSLLVDQNQNTINLNLGQTIHQGSAYYLEFWAEAGNPNFTVSLSNGTDNEVFASVATLGLSNSSRWSIYKFNLDSLGHEVNNNNENLIISNAAARFFIDNIRLVEITDRYYLLKNTLSVPSICNNDTLGNYVGPYINLGCKAYKDRSNSLNYLHNFNSLCQDSAVGCEEMIDTHNSTAYQLAGYNGGADGDCSGDGQDCKIVPADSITYVVYDKDKKCNAADKGCQRLGGITNYENNYTFTDVYYKNNPDNYDKIMCSLPAEGCAEWQANDGATYFHDPGNQVCEYRQRKQTGDNEVWAWFKTPVKRCDANGNGTIESAGASPEIDLICTEDKDCANTSGLASTTKCILDENDYPCDTDPLKTIGYGGGATINQPTNGWAGFCPAEQSSCTELIDPVSHISPNLISFAPASWTGSVQSNIKVEPNTLYRFASGPHNANAYSVNCEDDGSNPATLYLLNNNNEFGNVPIILAASNETNSLLFLNVNGVKCAINAPGYNTTLELRQAIINYQLSENMDKDTCNGMINVNDGCILFNQREQNGAALADFKWDANLPSPFSDISVSFAPQAGTVATNNNANQLIKVRPDRVCNKWLGCQTHNPDMITKVPVCSKVGNCTAMNPSGACTNWETHLPQTHNFSDTADQNTTGYVKLGSYYFGDMTQTDDTVINNVANGNFESYDDDSYAKYWQLTDVDTNAPEYSIVIHSPSAAQHYGISYPVEGRGILRLGAQRTLASTPVVVNAGKTYYLSYRVNTYYLKSIDHNASARLNITGAGVNRNDDTREGEEGWQIKIVEFQPTASGEIVISLSSTPPASTPAGALYFDDIKIEPILQAGPSELISRICRLYPKSDSASCDFYDLTQGVGRGIYGYCLLYDRYPGDSKTCLIWYPVDKIKSQFINERGIGYDGKPSVFYCSKLDANFDVVEYRADNEVWATGQASHCCMGGSSNFDFGSSASCGGDTNYESYEYDTPDSGCDCDSDCHRNWGIMHCRPRNDATHRLIYQPLGATGNDGWYEYDGSLTDLPGGSANMVGDCGDGSSIIARLSSMGIHEAANHNPAVMIFDHVTNQLIDPAKFRLFCDEFYEVVNEAGQNMAWTARVKTGSTYGNSSLLGYDYASDDTPFGSARPPLNKTGTAVASPRTWAQSNSGQRLSFQDANDYRLDVMAGLPYGCDDRLSLGQNSCELIGRCSNNKDILCLRAWRGEAGPTVSQAWPHGKAQIALGCPDQGTCDQIVPLIQNHQDHDATKYLVGRIFASSWTRSYWDSAQSSYVTRTDDQIVPPLTPCPVGSEDRGAHLVPPQDLYCFVNPQLTTVNLTHSAVETNLLVNGSTVSVGKDEYSLALGIRIDPEQLPLREVKIDWGDGQRDTDSGNLNDNVNALRYISHSFSFIDPNADQETVTIRVSIIDNWGKQACFPVGNCPP